MLTAYLTFYSWNTPYKSWFFCMKKVAKGIKNPQFRADLKEVHNYCFKQCKKNVTRKTDFLVFFQAICIFWKKNLGHFLTQELCTFWNQRKIADFLIPLATFFKLIFFNSYKGRWYYFWRKKGQISKKPFNILKTRFFIN